MVDFSSFLPAGLPANPTLLPTLLDLLPMGVMYYTPVVDATGTLTDLTLVYLNPAAQRMTQLPAQPGTTYRQQFPTTDDNGAWEFHRRSWVSQAPEQFQFYYDADGFDSYFRVTAQRLGEGLLTIFTDTQDEVRSQVEEALRESQAAEQAARAEAERQRGELERVFEQAPLAIAVYRGPAYTIELANPTVARLWGRTREQLVGKGLFEALPEVAGLGYEELLDNVMATGVPYVARAMEAQHDRHGRRETVYWDFVYVPMHAADGRIDGAMVVATEVTEQVEARQQVEQLNQQLEAARAAAERERAQLQALLTQAPVAIALFQGDNLHVATVNSEMAALWGHPLDHVRDRPLLEGVPELRGQGFDELLRQVMATRVPFVGTEVPAQLLRGGQLQTSYYNFVYQPLYDAQGQVAGVIDVAVEVTEQVLARRQVEQLNGELEARVQQRTQEADTARRMAEVQKKRLEQLFLQAPAAICILAGSALVFELANPAYQQFFPGRALHGLPLLQALPELTNQPIWDVLQEVYRTGTTQTDLGVRVPLARTDRGPLEDFYFDYVFQARRNPAGQVDGVVVFCFDVSEQVLARQQVQSLNEALTTTNADLHQSNIQLTRTNVDLDNFIYTASHDLKAPITNIEGLLLALEHELPDAARIGDVPLMLMMMQDAVDRFRRTIDHLTDLSRLQKEHNPASDAVALAPVVDAVRLDLAPLLTQTQGHLAVSIPEGLTVTFAEKNLRSVVYNLLSNAFKYHHPDRRPEVQLRGWLADDHAVLEVQDNGLGLDLAQGQERLFAMFQRLHTHVEGTGVGLYMVKRMVENAGGRIEVTSQLGQGSTFRVYFQR